MFRAKAQQSGAAFVISPEHAGAPQAPRLEGVTYADSIDAQQH